MRPEKYTKIKDSFNKWYAASEAYFHYKEGKEFPYKPTKIFDEGQWHTYQCEMEYVPETRETTAKAMVQYLKDCGKDPTLTIKQLKDEYGVTV